MYVTSLVPNLLYFILFYLGGVEQFSHKAIYHFFETKNKDKSNTV